MCVTLADVCHMPQVRDARWHRHLQDVYRRRNLSSATWPRDSEHFVSGNPLVIPCVCVCLFVCLCAWACHWSLFQLTAN